MPNNIGAFGENFPYANQHDMNMDWVIKTVKDFLDKYTTINEAVETGKEEIEELYNHLNDLLNQWYETHSEDIANELANAITEIGNTLDTSLDNLNSQLELNTTTFNQRAEQKGQDVIDSIPSEYTELAEKVQNLIENNAFNLLPKMTGSHTNNGITFSWNTDGSCNVSGTQSGGASSTENIYYETTLMPTGFHTGETYFVSFNSSNKMRLQVVSFDNNGSLTSLFGEYHSGQFTIPSNAIGMFIRLLVIANATVNETVKPIIRDSLSNAELSYNQVDLRPDVEELQSDVAQLQKHELTMNFSSATNLNSTSLWEQGSISPTTGQNVANSERIRTISYLETNISDVSLPDDTRGFFVCGYAEDGTFLGVYSSDRVWTIDAGTGYQSLNLSEIYTQYPTARLRLYLYSRDGSPITLEEAQYIEMHSIYNQLINPVTVRVMQNNIGQWNFGHDGGWSGEHIGLKLSNYRKLLNTYHPNIVGLQEFRQYVDADNTRNANNIIFSQELPYMSYEEYGYVAFMDYIPNNFRHTYLHTSGDYPARMVYGSAIINNQQVAIGTSALNALGSSDDASMKKRALTKMINLLDRYPTAIVCMDANVQSEAEANAVKNFMRENGYISANWDYVGYLPTYNPSSSIYKCIDTIFIKGKARFKNVTVVPTSEYNNLLSDHLPIIADILIYQ